MNYAKNLLAIASLIVAIGQPVTSSTSLRGTCNWLMTDLSYKGFADSQEAFQFAKKWLEEKSRPFSSERRVIKAWEAVVKGEECSQASWNNAVILGTCIENFNEEIVEGPLRAYTTRCLTPDRVSKKINSEANGLLYPEVKFISADFIKKYHEDNPDGMPLFVEPSTSLGRQKGICCDPMKSTGAIVQTIEKVFAEKRKQPNVEFHGNKKKFMNYMKRHLIKPCDYYSHKMFDFEGELATIARFHEKGNEALIASLDQEAQNALFRYKYCFYLEIHGEYLMEDVAKYFV